ncbi:hypothetical protein ABPG75_010567 [Micractinium tetrahymenae]
MQPGVHVPVLFADPHHQANVGVPQVPDRPFYTQALQGASRELRDMDVYCLDTVTNDQAFIVVHSLSLTGAGALRQERRVVVPVRRLGLMATARLSSTALHEVSCPLPTPALLLRVCCIPPFLPHRCRCC